MQNFTNMIIIVPVLVALLLICIGIFFYTWYRLHTSVAMHVPANNDTPAEFGLKYQTKYIRTSDGLTIAAWDIPVKNPKASIILVHGYTTKNGGKTNMLAHTKYLHAAGYSTFLIDLRAFGGSNGKKITFGVQEWKDVKAAYDYLRSLPENKKIKIGLFGISMGAATAIVTAGKTAKGDFVIASVPYADFKRMFRFQLQLEKLPPGLFLPLLRLAGAIEFGIDYDSFTPSHFIIKIHVPILLIGADKDEKVASSDAQSLYNLANAPKKFWQANTIHDVYKENPQEFKKKVLDFLKSI